MKICNVAVMAVMVGTQTAMAVSLSTNPVAKVIELLSSLEAKIIKEGEAAQTIYDEFSEWCEDTSKELHFSIKTEKSEIAELSAVIGKATSTIDALGSKIEGLVADIAADKKDLAKATAIREKENADFLAEEAELMDTVSMIERAVAVIEKEMAKGGAALLQNQMKQAGSVVKALQILVQGSLFAENDARKLSSFLQNVHTQSLDMGLAERDQYSDRADADLQAMGMSQGAPDPAVYESKSGGIVDTLEDLLEKATTQLDDARNAETKSKNEFEVLKQSLTDEIRFAEEDLEESKKKLSETEETKATAEGDLAVTSKDLAEDTKALADLHAECQTKAAAFEGETKSRDEELGALAKAKSILTEMAAGATAQTYGLEQTSLLQLSTRPGSKAVSFIKALANKYRNKSFAQLASRMASTIAFASHSGEDPFAKVKGLISDMIEKLIKEGEEAATHHAYCTKEKKETKAAIEDKTAELEKLTIKIDKATAMVAKLKEEVAELGKELADLAKSQAEMDKIRADEKAAYDVNKPEMEQGLKGVQMAIKVLKDYYSTDAAHGSAEGAGSSIIGILEVVEADFSKGLAEMISAEEAAVAAHEAQTKENEITKVAKDQDVKYKNKEITSLEKDISEHSQDKEGVETELASVNEYMAKLEEMCAPKTESYEERKARREQEIAGLKEALNILESEALLQFGHKRMRR